VDFSRPEVASVEAALDAHAPGRWRRADENELRKHAKHLRHPIGWRLRVRPDEFACPGIDRMFVWLDDAFPITEPRICAPQSDRNFTWPHVEPGGLLCLKQTERTFDPGERVVAQLNWAFELLRLDGPERESEFAREFAAYWGQRATEKAPRSLSLARAAGPSRELVYCDDWHYKRVIVAEDRQGLSDWLVRSGRAPIAQEIRASYLVWLEQPWRPAQFPETGKRVLDAIPRDVQSKILVAGQSLPVLVGALTDTGPVLVGVVLKSAPEKKLRAGFRKGSPVPFGAVANSFAAFQVKRSKVERIDGAWVHGRDHNEDYERLAVKKVAIVGCGALGGFVARLLIQGGVGRLILIDDDTLSAHNVSRHVLGLDALGQNKARALAAMLARDFPHNPKPIAFISKVQKLSDAELAEVASADLVISAGIDYEGDMRLDKWRRGCAPPPPHVCTWAEEFAVAGHALAIFGDHTLGAAFTDGGAPAVALTDAWPAAARVVEAGCANIFQPHGAVDMQSIVTLAARLSLDVLNGRVTQSCRRTWQGDRQAVIARGGTPRSGFDDSFVEQTHAWPIQM
jgi:hypothetical protein